MMWGKGELHVFANDKNRETFCAGWTAWRRASAWKFMRMCYGMPSVVPDTTNTFEEYWHNGEEM